MFNAKAKRIMTTLSITVLAVLLLTTFLIPAIADTYIPGNTEIPPWETMAFVWVRPNPIGNGQSLLVQIWLSPRPRSNYDVYYKYKFTFTDPDGIKDIQLLSNTEHTGSTWFEYIVTKIGTWTLDFEFEGYDAPGAFNPPAGWDGLAGDGDAEYNWQQDHDYWLEEYNKGTPGFEPWMSGDHDPCSTSVTFEVQQDPTPTWPAAPLPTDGWNWPVSPENREWSQLMGYWPMSKYNNTKTCINPYTESVDSPHVLWKLPPYSDLGGMVGGIYGAGEYMDGSSIGFNSVAAGRAYDTRGGRIWCHDLRTGEVLWDVPGSYSVLTIESGEPVLVQLSGTYFRKYNGFTGDEMIERDHPQFVTQTWVDPYVVCLQELGDMTYCVKWDTSGSTNTFANRVEWNVTYWDWDTQQGIRISDYEWTRGGGANVATVADYNTMCFLTYPLYGESGAFDMWTGDLLWHKYIEDFESRFSIGGGYGKAFVTEWPCHWVAWNMRTGERDWTGDEAYNPWGNFWAYNVACGYDKMIGVSYDGHMWAYDVNTGHWAWNYSVGVTDPYLGETPYGYTDADGVQHGSWSLFTGPIGGGGVMYGATSEWGTPHPYYRGQSMVAVDTYTGNEIWQLKGSWSPGIIAEGYLLATSRYDAHSYCFGRGPTATTVSLPRTYITTGESTWISGRVTDESPAQPGTPAVSKASMAAWMEYLHLQQPRPLDTVGVDVSVYATDSDGTLISIGTTTSDGEGYYRIEWTPPDEGHYTIAASFNGDESYYSSYAVTGGLVVGPTPQEYPESPTAEEMAAAIKDTLPDYELMFIGLIVAVVVVAILIAIDIIIRRRQ